MTTTLYGIANCDSVKKARKWLESHNIDYQFHDFRKQGLEEGKIKDWLACRGIEVLLNKRGTTWRQLPEHIKSSVTDTTIVPLMNENPTLIKRPVLEFKNQTVVGFKDSEYNALFK